MTKVKYFDIENDYGPHIDKDRENILFEDVYKKAFNLINEIVEQNIEEKNNKKFINNIISFIGSRGSGKTSALYSMKGFLEENSVKDKKQNLCSQKFHVLDLIDPSMLDENNSILRIITGMLLSRINDSIDNIAKENDLIEFYNLLSTIFNNVKTMKNREIIDEYEKEDSAEALSGLVETIETKKIFEKLVKKYLEIMGNGDNYLVIIIDDMDMNIKSAFKMIDEINKYMTVKKVIILMGFKMEQLEDSTRIDLYKKLSKLEKTDNEEYMKNKIYDISERYIQKLFPTDRRIYLTDLQSKNINIHKTNLTPQEYFYSKIYEKTELILAYKANDYNPIFPSNIREYKNFIYFLEKLPTASKDITSNSEENYKEEKIKNLAKFKSYILNEWIGLHISNTKFRRILKGFKRIPNGLKNKFIVREIYTEFNKDIEELEKRKEIVKIKEKFEEIESIIHPLNSEKNITLGDVLFLLDMLENMKNGSNEKTLFFVIRLLYSIDLHMYYYALPKNRWSRLKELIHGSFKGSLLDYDIPKIQGQAAKKSIRVNFNFEVAALKINSCKSNNLCTIEILNNKISTLLKDNNFLENLGNLGLYYDDFMAIVYFNSFLTYGAYQEKTEKQNIYYKEFKRHKRATFDILNFFVYLIDMTENLKRIFSSQDSLVSIEIIKIGELENFNENMDNIMFIVLNLEIFMQLIRKMEEKYDTVKQKSTQNFFENVINQILIDNIERVIRELNSIYNLNDNISNSKNKDKKNVNAINFEEKLKKNYFFDYLKYGAENGIFNLLLQQSFEQRINIINLKVIEEIKKIINSEHKRIEKNINKTEVSFKTIKDRNRKLNKQIKDIKTNTKAFPVEKITEKIKSIIEDIESNYKNVKEKMKKDDLKKIQKNLESIIKNDLESKIYRKETSSIDKTQCNIIIEKNTYITYINREIDFIDHSSCRKKLYESNNELFNNRIERIKRDLKCLNVNLENKKYKDNAEKAIKNLENIKNFEELKVYFINIKEESFKKTSESSEKNKQKLQNG